MEYKGAREGHGYSGSSCPESSRRAATAALTPRGSARRRLAALTGLNVLSYVDRQLVAALAPLLIADLALTRAQVGLLMGVAFIVVFAIATIVSGFVADRLSRSRVVAVGLGLWSAATALTGTASGLGSLAVWRGLVGVGEATLSPSALAMLGDTFPPVRLGLASGVFYAGIPIGSACSFALAGWLAPWLGWRACFAVLGSAGLLAAVFAWRMVDPPRRSWGSSNEPGRAEAGAGSRLVRALREQPALGLVILGSAALGYTSASSQLSLTWLVQERGFGYARAAWLSAAMTAVTGLVGSLVIGALSDRARRGGPAGRLHALAAMGAVSLLLTAGFYTAPAGSPAFFACWVGAQTWLLGWFGPVFAAIQDLARAEARATVVAFGLLVLNLLGVATGPWITGLIGDRASLTRGLLVSVAVGAVGLLLVAAAARCARAPAPPPGVLPSAPVPRRS
jgi:MFS family permease